MVNDERPVHRLTHGPGHHFFGYYDKCPWDSTGRYILALEADFMDRPPGAEDRAVVGMVHIAEESRWIPLAETSAWSWQQGAMLQWLPSAPDRLIIYNAREGDRFVSVVRDVHTGESRTLPRPVYAVSHDGRSAVTPSFSRLQHCRPGYGYAGVPDPWIDDPAPEDDGIWWMDLETGLAKLIISVAQVAALEPEPSMEGAKHWFNHLEFNPNDSRFVFLHRWRKGEQMWRTRMFTACPDGSHLYCLAKDDYVSHFAWRDERHILAFAHQRDTGVFFYLFTDCSAEKEIVGRGVLKVDGHCSYSPQRRWILTDTYPDPEDRRALLLFRPEDGRHVTLGRFYSPPLLEEIRCDLHPRWSRDGMQVCIDSAHEGGRQIYVVDVRDVVA